MRTELAEAERRRDTSQEIDYFQVLYASSAREVRGGRMHWGALSTGAGERGVRLLRFGIVFGPETNEFVEMVRPEDGPIASQVVEVVHDDSHEQIDNL